MIRANILGRGVKQNETCPSTLRGRSRRAFLLPAAHELQVAAHVAEAFDLDSPDDWSRVPPRGGAIESYPGTQTVPRWRSLPRRLARPFR